MADALIRILGADDPAVRVAAGEAILDVGYERYAEIARAIERALDAGTTGPAMAELPYVLAEIGEPSALPLIRRFLSSADAETVAAGIEAIASIGDPAALEDLARLEGDDRVVDVGDLDEGGSVTIGELVEAAIEEIEPRESR
jgi:HEAT repeat protein